MAGSKMAGSKMAGPEMAGSEMTGSETRQKERKALPDCRKCRSHKVTWDRNQPHACLFFSFKSYHLPAVEVYNSTGMACPQYRLAEKHAQRAMEEKNRFQDRVTNGGPAGRKTGMYSDTGQLLPPAESGPKEGAQDSAEDTAKLGANTEREGPEAGAERAPKTGGKFGQILGEKGILL
ncbi:hypothetical protein P0082_05920 [Candidatus Haliotispira prima]|uniref:Uncharacterized protein n=1 Tax=Candidatus Haliotispira prima TaxID=3034016 RepID=A0ABY8MKJ6_9SPIO|nr:hypothetical protein P0082_05920 [Candidatus Haliotispira prima]